MSKEEIHRFADDLKQNSDMLDELKEAAGGVTSVVEFANGKGYEFEADHVREYVTDQANTDLSDEQIEAIVGGKGHHHHHHHSSSTYTQSAAVTQTYAATNTVEAVDVATTVAVAAEGVVVVT